MHGWHDMQAGWEFAYYLTRTRNSEDVTDSASYIHLADFVQCLCKISVQFCVCHTAAAAARYATRVKCCDCVFYVQDSSVICFEVVSVIIVMVWVGAGETLVSACRRCNTCLK